MIQNLITNKNLPTNHFRLDKNTIAMAKYPPKHLDIKSNKITKIHRHVKVKRLKKLHQQL